MDKHQLQAALDEAAAKRDPYAITQRTLYRERVVEYWRFGAVDAPSSSGGTWLGGIWREVAR